MDPDGTKLINEVKEYFLKQLYFLWLLTL